MAEYRIERREMKRKVFCIYCALEMYYEDGASPDAIEKIYNEMKKHDL